MAASGWVVVLGAAEGTGWETYGPLGLAVLALGTFAMKAYSREANRADRLEMQIIEYVPQLIKSIEILEAELARQRRS